MSICCEKGLNTGNFREPEESGRQPSRKVLAITLICQSI